MLQVHLGNRLEALLDRLALELAAPGFVHRSECTPDLAPGFQLELDFQSQPIRPPAAPPDPFAPTHIVVQNQGMARWVAQGLAERLGVAANLTFPLPARFFWGLLAAWVPDLPERSDWDRERLLWRVFARLPGLCASASAHARPVGGFAGPARYLAGEPRELKTYQLALRIADLFDQYLVYRPEMVLGWEAETAAEAPGPNGGRDGDLGPDAGWQAALWRDLVAAGVSGEISGGSAGETAEGGGPRPPGPHRAALFARLEQALAQGVPPIGPLPERVLIFGLSALPPLYCRVLGRLAEHLPVDLFALSPCREYWADLADEGRRARTRARELGKTAQARRTDGRAPPQPKGTASRPDPAPAAALLDLGNPLLAAWGRAGMAFQDQLIEMGGEPLEYFVDPCEDLSSRSLLARLQSDILSLTDSRTPDPAARAPLDPADGSLQVHACHGPHREVQVLHDRLLRLFEALPDLRPRDILAMAPDIDVFAPHIESVFGPGPGRAAAHPDAGGAELGGPHIPWSIADRRLAAEEPLLAAVAALLGLPDSRLGAAEVLSWLAVPALARRFGLEGERIGQVRTWVTETGVRWGLDADMRGGLDLPATDANTWAFGLRRLFLGYALPPEERLHGEVLPYPDLEGLEAEALGGLQTFIDTLARWRADLPRPRPPAEWAAAVNRLLDDFTDPDEDEDAVLQPLREALDALRADTEAAGFDSPLGLSVLRAQVADCLAGSAPVQRFLTGRVTFCNMVPMRSIPARVVCLLGLNGSDFPRGPRPPAFDLMQLAPRRGDRSRREDDRWLFLEALLAARDCLHLSYVGNDPRDNGVRVPSVLVDELLAYVRAAFRLPDGSDPAKWLTVRHPLQPFSRRCFDGSDPRIASFRATWCRAAQASPEDGAEGFCPGPLGLPLECLEGTGSPGTAGAGSPLPTPRSALDIDDLIRFLKSPADWFLRRVLGIARPEDAEALEESEPFALDGLTGWSLRQELFALAQAGRGGEAAPRLRAAGALPHGHAGDLICEEAARRVEDFRLRLAPYPDARIEPLELDLELAGLCLRGWLAGLTEAGLVVPRLSRMRSPPGAGAGDLLALWVRHLALNLAAPPALPRQSVLVAEDLTLRLGPVADARERLADLIELFERGQREPLPLFPKTSLVLARKGWGQAVTDAWEGGWHDPSGGEGAGWAVRTAFRGRDPLAPPFEDLALRVFGPLAAALDEEADR